MDFDPRWTDDPRDDDRDDGRTEESGRELNQGSRGISSDPLERDARDPRDVFTRDLDLPRGPDRERVWFREHSVLLRGSESLALATTGAFRVVHADDLRDSRGQAYDTKGEYDLAIADYSQSLRLNRDNPRAFFNRAVAYANKGEHQRAVADFNEAIKLDPQDADAYLGRGAMHEELDNEAAARADYQKALQIVPEHEDAKEALARLGN